MLQKKYRLTKRLQGKIVTIFSSSFTLKFVKSDNTQTRIGFVVSKKTAALATVRNRTKRRLRSCIEKMFPKIHTGYDLLFVIKKEAITRPTDTLCKEVQTVFEKQHMFAK